MSAVLAVALTTSIVVGTGFAAPKGSEIASDTVPVAEGVQTDASGGGGGKAGPTDQQAGKAADPATDPATEPAATAEPAAAVQAPDAEPAVQEAIAEPAASDQSAAPTDAVAVSEPQGSDKKSTPGPTVQVAAAAAADVPLEYATIPEIEEWSVGQDKWTKGDTKGWHEDDWVPTRVFIDNTGGKTDLLLPGFKLGLSGYNDGPNAIAADDVRGFVYWVAPSLPTVVGVGSPTTPLTANVDGRGTRNPYSQPARF